MMKLIVPENTPSMRNNVSARGEQLLERAQDRQPRADRGLEVQATGARAAQRVVGSKITGHP